MLLNHGHEVDGLPRNSTRGEAQHVNIQPLVPAQVAAEGLVLYAADSRNLDGPAEFRRRRLWVMGREGHEDVRS